MTDWKKVVKMLYEDKGRKEIIEDDFVKEILRKYSDCDRCLEDLYE